MFRVLAFEGSHEKGLELLRSRSDLVKLEMTNATTPPALTEAVSGVDAIIVRTAVLTRDILAEAPNLRIVSRHGVGYDNVDVAYLSSRGIPMALAVDSNVTSVAEHTLMLLLALAKDTFACDREQRRGNYKYRDRRTAVDIGGRTALVLGYGRIGRQVAKVLGLLGMHVRVFDPYVKPEQLDAGQTYVSDYRAALPQADVVSLHVPLTPETAGCIGAAELATMKPTAFLLNCARGGLVDEAALYAALKERRLAGAGLDVFENEPPDADNPLFTLENVIVSPHNAALTDECAARMSLQAARNVIDCLEGRLEPRVVVNRKELDL